MTATEIARAAVKDTAAAAAFVSPDVRAKLAVAYVATVVAGMDDSISATVRMLRLQDGIAAVYEILNAD